jgi:hypothetical protein
MSTLRRRWRLTLVICGLALVLVVAGGYAFLALKDRHAPPPLTLDSHPAISQTRVPDGVWTSSGKGRLEIVGGWIEAGLLPSRGGVLRLPVPIDLTDVPVGRPADVRVSKSIHLEVLWRGAKIRIRGTAGGASVDATYHRNR